MSLSVMFFAILIWQGAIQRLTGFKYIDEIVEVLLLLVILFNYRYIQKNFNKFEKLALVSVVLFYVFGTVSTVVNNYQRSIVYGLESGFLSLKCFISFFGVLICIRKYKIKKKNLNRIKRINEYGLFISAILLVIDLLIPIFPQESTRFGISSTPYIFGHPTELASYAIISMMVSLYLNEYLGKKGNPLLNYFPAIICVIRAGRVRSVAFLAFVLFVRLLLPAMRKIKILHMLWGLPVFVAISWERISVYLSRISTSVRPLLYIYGFRIALDRFPLGSGFGTFGTEFSRRRYSVVYDMYGLSNVWGMSRVFDAYITDAMWASILGETGFVGVIALIMFFVYLVISIYRSVKDKRCLFVIISIVIYSLINSLVDSVFMSYLGGIMFSVIALFYELEYSKDSGLLNKIQVNK